MIAVDVHFTDDYLKHTQRLSEPLNSGVPYALTIGGLAVLVVIARVTSVLGSLTALGCLVALGAVAAVHIVPRRWARIRHPLRNGVVHFGFDEEGVDITTPEQSSRSSWTLVSSWQTTRHALLLRIGEGAGGYVIPRSAISTESDWEDLIELFQRRAGRTSGLKPGPLRPEFARSLAIWAVLLLVLFVAVVLPAVLR